MPAISVASQVQLPLCITKKQGHAMASATGVIILTVSRRIKVRKWSCFPLTRHLGGDFDHGKIMRPAQGKLHDGYTT